MTPALRRILLATPFNPYRLPGIASRYSLDGGPSDATYLIDGSNRLQLVADRSGNSAENCLVLNAVSGNYASSPDSAATRITGDIDLRCDVALVDWTPSSTNTLIAKRTNAAPGNCYYFDINNGGRPRFTWSVDGTTDITVIATTALTQADSSRLQLRVTMDVDNGAGGYTVTIYVRAYGDLKTNDGWAVLGIPIIGAAPTSIHAGSDPIGIGSLSDAGVSALNGRIYRAMILSGINGTVAFDADFTRVAKLASSFTESSANAATVTINTSGDTGARICGERDLVQLTQTKQPIFSVAADGRHIATFDGVNDYLKSAPFSYSQPESVYFVGSQVTWTDADYIFDGNAANAMRLNQRTLTPNIGMNAGGTSVDSAALLLESRGVVSAVFSGANSSLRVNRGTRVTGSAGTASGGGYTLGATSTGSANANITWSESLLAARADSDAIELKTNGFYARKWGIYP